MSLVKLSSEEKQYMLERNIGAVSMTVYVMQYGREGDLSDNVITTSIDDLAISLLQAGIGSDEIILSRYEHGKKQDSIMINTKDDNSFVTMFEALKRISSVDIDVEELAKISGPLY